MNIYRKGDFIDWHTHWPKEKNSWHGFFCVDCEPSYTTYRLPNRYEPVNVTSENNLLVIGKSDNDRHRSSEWPYTDRDRITIAFDIIPRQSIVPCFPYDGALNHWIPF